MISTYNVFSKAQIYNKYFITFVFSLVNAFFNFWFFRIALKELGEESFYYYAYSRRIISFISPILMMGVGVGLPRYMGIYYKYKRDVSPLLSAGLLIVLMVSIFWALINLALNNYLTTLLWGELTEFTLLLNLSICLNLIAINVWAVLHSYFRGKLMVFSSGVLLLISQSAIPFLGFYFMGSLNVVYNFISLLLLGITFLILIVLYRQKSIVPKIKDVIKLFKYGLSRIPGDLALSLLVFLPSLFAITFLNIEYAGIISFAGAILTLSAIPASAISFNMLSRSSFLYLEDKKLLRIETIKIIIGGLLYGIIVFVLLSYLLEFLITWFLDKSLLKHIEILKYFLIAIPPYIIFVLLRSVIDGTKTKAYNSKNLIFALFTFIVFGLIAITNHSIYTIIFGIIAAYCILALLSLIRVFKIFK